MSEEAISFSPAELEKLNLIIREISAQMTKKEILSESIKDDKKSTIDDLKSSGLTSARLTTMVNLYHKNNKEEYFSEISDQEAMYENIFPKNKRGA